MRLWAARILIMSVNSTCRTSTTRFPAPSRLLAGIALSLACTGAALAWRQEGRRRRTRLRHRRDCRG
jgi:hypothetical protein